MLGVVRRIFSALEHTQSALYAIAHPSVHHTDVSVENG